MYAGFITDRHWTVVHNLKLGRGLLIVQPEILQNGIGDKNFVQIKMYYVTSRRGGRCVLPRIAVIANFFVWKISFFLMT